MGLFIHNFQHVGGGPVYVFIYSWFELPWLRAGAVFCCCDHCCCGCFFVLIFLTGPLLPIPLWGFLWSFVNKNSNCTSLQQSEKLNHLRSAKIKLLAGALALSCSLNRVVLFFPRTETVDMRSSSPVLKIKKQKTSNMPLAFKNAGSLHKNLFPHLGWSWFDVWMKTAG